jgi:hypothetical protein
VSGTVARRAHPPTLASALGSCPDACCRVLCCSRAFRATAKVATDNLYGRNYRQGPTFTTIYPASGLGLDYMYYSDINVPFSIATEMRSSNGNGPVDPVLPGSEELWEGIKAAGLYVLNNYEADPESIAARGRPVLRKRKHDGH